ncbi:carboxymuconolactone decarboxylase family protein [Bradyrhizobium sp. Pha-3]|uniref:carboxymuconolactone decarboxylase family protein n=1 Tax=Bradyrhizobium sp. Pha-3 TaxID=208375 RepID=UPI0035D451DE
MMLDWNTYRQQLKVGVGELGKINPNVVGGYVQMSGAGSKSNLLSPKVRELIALAVAVTARCDGCITIHVDAAIRNGATLDEIAEALGVAISVNAGAAMVYTTRVMDAFHQHPNRVGQVSGSADR